MIKNLILLNFFLIILIGCKDKTENHPLDIDEAFFKDSNIVFRDTNFTKLIDDIITSQPIAPSNGYNSILVYLSLQDKDTIMTLINQPPYEKTNLKAFYYYNTYRLHFYSSDNLEKKLETFIELNPIEKSIKDKINILDEESLVSYQANYLVNGKKIKLKNLD